MAVICVTPPTWLKSSSAVEDVWTDQSLEWVSPNAAQSIWSCVLYDTKIIFVIKQPCNFWKKWEKNASRPIISPCLQEHKWGIPSYLFGSTQCSAEHPLPLWTSRLTRWQLKDCKCCILKSGVNLAALLSPVRPRSSGISPHVLCCRSCLWLLG